MEDASVLVSVLADAALQAWHTVADDPRRHDEVGMGADGTPSTRADMVLEQAMLQAAGAAGLSVLSEEAGFVDHGSEMVAVIDPLDGSRNAGRGIPFHCTSVAIGRGSLKHIEAAAVCNLVTSDLYHAVRGGGAHVNDRPITHRPFDADEIMVGLITDPLGGGPDELGRQAGHHVRDLGAAALEMCLVGTGALDAFVVRKPWLRVVDIAAATLIVREAGGRVIDPATGEDLVTPLSLEPRTGVLAAHSAEALEAVL